MEMEQILKLIETISDSPLTEFQYDADGVKISLKKDQPVMAGEEARCAVPLQKEELIREGQAAPEKESAPAGHQEKAEGKYVKSPLVGTFYAAPAEDAEPFVQVGDEVAKGQILGIVEAMKLMNDIESEYSGKVAEILVKNGDAVEYGQPLFRIV